MKELTPPHARDFEWRKIRQLLWDDDEHVVIAKSVASRTRAVPASKITVQPVEPFCAFNSFQSGKTRCKKSLAQLHTFVIEMDDVPLEEQRQTWAGSDLPHTLRVFSGNKSIHVWIRLSHDVNEHDWRRLADALMRNFPDADPKVLKNASALCRAPNGRRTDKQCSQIVEFKGGRVDRKDLEKWLDGGVNRDTKIQRHREKLKRPEVESQELDVGVWQRIDDAEEMYKRTNPKLFGFYLSQVNPRWKGQKHARNAILMEIVPFLFTAVCHEAALVLAGMFYQLNQHVFHDPIEKHVREAEHLWQALELDYVERLSPEELKRYSLLDELRKTVFRIARSLANEINEIPYGSLTMPRHHWAVRLQCSPATVQKVIGQFCDLGIVECTRKGRSHQMTEDGMEQGICSVYRWSLPRTEQAAER